MYCGSGYALIMPSYSGGVQHERPFDIRYGIATMRHHQYVQQIHLSAGKRGVIYVRSYETGGVVSRALECPFYRARAESKGEVLQQWVQGAGGWIVATGALGTGINI
jgi:hypothetical protein